MDRVLMGSQALFVVTQSALVFFLPGSEFFVMELDRAWQEWRELLDELETVFGGKRASWATHRVTLSNGAIRSLLQEVASHWALEFPNTVRCSVACALCLILCAVIGGIAAASTAFWTCVLYLLAISLFRRPTHAISPVGILKVRSPFFQIR
jgi:hypothetical protein